MARSKKRSKAQKRKDWEAAKERLKSMPEELLSPAGRYWLKYAGEKPGEISLGYAMR